MFNYGGSYDKKTKEKFKKNYINIKLINIIYSDLDIARTVLDG